MGVKTSLNKLVNIHQVNTSMGMLELSFAGKAYLGQQCCFRPDYYGSDWPLLAMTEVGASGETHETV